MGFIDLKQCEIYFSHCFKTMKPLLDNNGSEGRENWKKLLSWNTVSCHLQFEFLGRNFLLDDITSGSDITVMSLPV